MSINFYKQAEDRLIEAAVQILKERPFAKIVTTQNNVYLGVLKKFPKANIYLSVSIENFPVVYDEPLKELSDTKRVQKTKKKNAFKAKPRARSRIK